MNNNVQPTPPPVVPAQNQQPNTGELSQDTLADFDNFMAGQGYTTPADTSVAGNGAPSAAPAAPSSSGASPAAAPSGEAAPAAQPPASAAPGGAAPASASAAPASSEGQQPAPAAPEATATQPGAEPPAAQPAAAPAPLKGDEKFRVRDDVELNRDQITFLLDAWNKGNTRDREAVDLYRQTFQMEPDQAQREWGPIVEFLRTSAKDGGHAPLVMQGVLDALMAGGRSAEEYLDRALQTYADHLQRHPQAQPAPQDRELRQRVERTERALEQQNLERAQAYVTQERNALAKEFPCLADAQYWQMFASSALPVTQQYPQYTLTQHAQHNRRALQAWQQAYDAAQAPRSQPTPAQPAQPAPALVPANGAAPAATRQTPGANDEKRFDSLSDPSVVDDFVHAYPEGL